MRSCFFASGIFYEMFYEDAIYASRVLSLTQTTPDKGKENPVPCAGCRTTRRVATSPGSPSWATRGHLRAAGRPQAGQGPGQARRVSHRHAGGDLDEESLEPRAPNYVAAVAGESRDGFGLAFIDVTTGDFRATEAATTEGLLDELARVDPREILLPRGQSDLAALVRRAYPRLAQKPRSASTTSPSPFPPWPTGLVLAGSGRLARAPQACLAASRVLRLRARGPSSRPPLPVARLELFSARRIPGHRRAGALALELTETMLERQTAGSLLDTLDVTGPTSMGAGL